MTLVSIGVHRWGPSFDPVGLLVASAKPLSSTLVQAQQPLVTTSKVDDNDKVMNIITKLPSTESDHWLILTMSSALTSNVFPGPQRSFISLVTRGLLAEDDKY